MDYPQLLDIVKRIGILRIAKAISYVAWIILPLWFWLIVSRTFGSELFMLYIAIPGLAFFVFELLFIVAQAYFMENQQFNVMRLIENAKALLGDPSDRGKDEKFRFECRRILLPFAIRTPIVYSFVSSLSRSRDLLLSTIVGFYKSYSIMTFLVIFRKDLVDSFNYVSIRLYQSVPQVQNIHFDPLENIWFVFTILWILSSYFDPFLRLVFLAKRFRISVSGAALLYSWSIPNSAHRISMLACEIACVPIRVAHWNQTKEFKPFFDPQSLPKIVEKTMQRVEGKDCDLIRWAEDLQDETKVDETKKLMMLDPKTPFLLKLSIRRASSKDLLRNIKEMQPIAYVAVQNERCVFLGLIRYDPIERVRRGAFMFDTTHLRKEFIWIYKEEQKTQRQLERGIPVKLEDLIKSWGERNV